MSINGQTLLFFIYRNREPGGSACLRKRMATETFRRLFLRPSFVIDDRHTVQSALGSVKQHTFGIQPELPVPRNNRSTTVAICYRMKKRTKLKNIGGPLSNRVSAPGGVFPISAHPIIHSPPMLPDTGHPLYFKLILPHQTTRCPSYA